MSTAPTPPVAFSTLLCSTPAEIQRCIAIRLQVFCEEQGFSEEDELDDLDPDSDHILLLSPTGEDAGTIRWNPTFGKLGRLAVSEPYRGTGAGRVLVQALEAYLRTREGKGGVANRGKGECKVNATAQIHAIPFYAKMGFTEVGEPFPEDGQPHQLMTKVLVLGE